MLRFDQNSRRVPRNYLLRREQTRLLSLVALLALVVLAMQQINGPRAVAMISQVFGLEPAAIEPINAVDNTAGANTDPAEPLATKSLDADQFEAVRDNTFLRNEEQRAWFYTLGELQQAPPASGAPVTFAQLASQPDAYRGRPVSLTGAARRAESVEPAANDLGIEKLTKVILQPSGGEVWPVTIYSLSPLVINDAEEPVLGNDINVPVTVRGYFFKNASYRWQGGMGVTPVLLAAELEPLTLPAAGAAADPNQPVDLATVVSTAVAIAVVLIAWYAVRTGFGQKERRPRGEQVTIAIADPEA